MAEPRIETAGARVTVSCHVPPASDVATVFNTDLFVKTLSKTLRALLAQAAESYQVVMTTTQHARKIGPEAAGLPLEVIVQFCPGEAVCVASSATEQTVQQVPSVATGSGLLT